MHAAARTNVKHRQCSPQTHDPIHVGWEGRQVLLSAVRWKDGRVCCAMQRTSCRGCPKFTIYMRRDLLDAPTEAFETIINYCPTIKQRAARIKAVMVHIKHKMKVFLLQIQHQVQPGKVSGTRTHLLRWAASWGVSLRARIAQSALCTAQYGSQSTKEVQ